jgi:hypothetical protein
MDGVTWTNDCEHFPEAVWDSGDIHSYQSPGASYQTGATFTLYLLPKTDFSALRMPGYDAVRWGLDAPSLPVSVEKYTRMCAAAGLHTVAAMDATLNVCQRYQCLNVEYGLGGRGDSGGYIHVKTGWDFIVTHGQATSVQALMHTWVRRRPRAAYL